jgi:hypothetical protein
MWNYKWPQQAAEESPESTHGTISTGGRAVASANLDHKIPHIALPTSENRAWRHCEIKKLTFNIKHLRIDEISTLAYGWYIV